jgi:hypothetical protein
MVAIRRAWWWMLDYGYAARWQARSLVTRVDPARFSDGILSPVLVIPGIYESWQFLRPMIEALHSAGHPVHVVTQLQHNRMPVPQAAGIVADYLRRENLTDVTIVAHSKGGLIGKLVMLQLDRHSQVSSMVAVCTPFSGSRYARFMLLPSLRAFLPTNATTVMLARELDVNERITSVFGLFDPHIPEGSELPGAHNIRIPTGGHFRIMSDARCIDAVLAAAAGSRSPGR